MWARVEVIWETKTTFSFSCFSSGCRCGAANPHYDCVPLVEVGASWAGWRRITSTLTGKNKAKKKHKNKGSFYQLWILPFFIKGYFSSKILSHYSPKNIFVFSDWNSQTEVNNLLCENQDSRNFSNFFFLASIRFPYSDELLTELWTQPIHKFWKFLADVLISCEYEKKGYNDKHFF